VRFDLLSSNVKNKNMGFHIFFVILGEVLQKVSKFSDSQKIFFWTVNYPIWRWKFHRNYVGCGKISLKIRIGFFNVNNALQQVSLHSNSQKYQNWQDPPKLAKLNMICGVDWCIGSTWSWTEVKIGLFFTPFPYIYWLITFHIKVKLLKLGFYPVSVLSSC